MYKREYYPIIKDVAKKLKIPTEWLKALIAFETAGTFRVNISNPNSSARGLLQFINSTARSLGYASSLDLVRKENTFEKQMKNAVYPYLKRFAPFTHDRDFYMSVFYPKYRNKPVKTMFPERVRRVNHGITDILSYINHVRRKAGMHPVKEATENYYTEITAGVIFGIFAISGAIYYYSKMKK